MDESQTCLEVWHKWLDLMGKLWIFFRADLPERTKRFPSSAGAEKFAADLNFGEKTPFLLRLVQDPATRSLPADVLWGTFVRLRGGYATRCQIEVTSLHFVL